MTATVFYDSANDIAVINATFKNSSGQNADPTTVTCIVTEPSGSQVTHSFGGPAPADIVKVGAGLYTLAVACAPSAAGIDGLWGFEWIGSGTVSDVQPGTWRVLPAATSQLWYAGLEEMADRLGITDATDNYALQTSIAASAGWINRFCVVPSTMILTADLRWIPAGDITLGQELIGVDEEPAPCIDSSKIGAARWLRGTNHGRRYRRAAVLAAAWRKAECVRLILEDGREVTCATDHRWLARHPWRGHTHPTPNGYHWMYARDVIPGDEIASPLRVWPEETSFEAGWVSGIFDGEGWLFSPNFPNGPKARAGFAQNPGPVLDGVLKYLDNIGIPHTGPLQPHSGQTCLRIDIGTRWAVMELMGRLRPRRLLPKAHYAWEGQQIIRSGRNSGSNNVRVVAAESAGVQEVRSLTTSTGTYLAEGLISHNCGRHFNRVTETRTYQPHNIWYLDVDDIVPGTPITVAVDVDGDGTFEQSWSQGTDYQLKIGPSSYNINASGFPEPYKQLQVIQSGKWFPFTWPYSHLDRVQINTTWGWPMVPWQVSEANRILAADLFKAKDAPFGIAGMGDFGVQRIASNPWLVELLHDFISGRRKVGV